MTNFGMLLGAFITPAVLLWAGHRLRARSARWRLAFWYATAAYGVTIPISMAAAMFPPETWEPTAYWRGFLSIWALTIAPAAGAGVGVLRDRRRRTVPWRS